MENLKTQYPLGGAIAPIKISTSYTTGMSSSIILDSERCWSALSKKLQQDTYIRQTRFGITRIPYQQHNIYSYTGNCITISHEDTPYFTITSNVCDTQTQAFDMCPQCWSFDIRHQSSGEMVCVNCFYNLGIDCCNETSYIESHGFANLIPLIKTQKEPRDFTDCHYKRVAHFNTWLNKIRGEEIYTINQNTIRVVQNYLVCRHLTFSVDNIITALKYTQNQKYYDNVYYLYKHFNGQALININSEQTSILLQLFHMIQEPFAKHRHTTNRVNMLHYGYLLLKFFELLEWGDLKTCIRPIKSKSKLYQLDTTWKLITEELGFPFHRSSM